MVKTLIALTPYLAMWNVEQNLRAEPESLEEGMSLKLVERWDAGVGVPFLACGRWCLLSPGSSWLGLPCS